MSNETNLNLWNFVEEYHPQYSSSDEVCNCLDLMLIEEERDLSQEEMEQLDYLKKCIYEEAIQGFVNLKKEL